MCRCKCDALSIVHLFLWCDTKTTRAWFQILDFHIEIKCKIKHIFSFEACVFNRPSALSLLVLQILQIIFNTDNIHQPCTVFSCKWCRILLLSLESFNLLFIFHINIASTLAILSSYSVLFIEFHQNGKCTTIQNRQTSFIFCIRTWMWKSTQKITEEEETRTCFGQFSNVWKFIWKCFVFSVAKKFPSEFPFDCNYFTCSVKLKEHFERKKLHVKMANCSFE